MDRRRVYLHVGLPKTGTTFLQGALAEHRKALKHAGVLYPENGKEPMFRAALDVRGNHKGWGRRRKEVEGTWDALCRKARSFDGTTLISHELLAATPARRADAALSMLRGLDVHLVVTARDPARQVTAEWQEGIKHGRKTSFADFRERILDRDLDHRHGRRFWAAQDLPDVLERWGADLPPANVHVVCCPPPEADPGLLWQRFADVVGFDAAALPPTGGGSNSSLGTVQIDLLRRVNTALADRLVQPAYGRTVKQYFTKRLLVRHPSPRPALPLDMYDGLVDLGTQWVKAIDRAGYTVHGDPDALVPRPPETAGPDPDDVDPRAEVETAAAVIADLLLEVDRLRA
ncbi:MAG: hypothetical protein ACXVW2_04935 [Nocardioidaceae bacterium]